MLAQVPLVWLFGPALWYGRLISLLSVAAVALCGADPARVDQRRIAAIAGLIFPPCLRRALVIALQGRLAGAGALPAGLFVVARWPEKRWSVFVSACFSSRPSIPRQTYILAAPLAAFVWLVAQGQRRRALETVAIAGGAGRSCLRY